MRIWRFSNKRPNLSAWGPDWSGSLLVGCNSGVIGEIVAVCTGVSNPWANVVAGDVFTLWFLRGVTFASLKSYHGYWSRTVDYFSIWWGIDTFKKHDLHDEATKRNTCSCCWSSHGLPNGLEDMGTDINRGPVIRSHMNWACPRLMKAVLDNR